MMFFGGGVLLVCIALHVAWIAKRAQARGRSVLGWVVGALVLSIAGVWLGLALELVASAGRDPSDFVTLLLAISPIPLGFAPLIGAVLLLLALPTRVSIGRVWPVFEIRAGAGKIVIEKDAIELRWAGHTERIPREALAAQADVEMLRLRWHDGTTDRELAVMPTGKPATREGRMRQAEVLAARLRA